MIHPYPTPLTAPLDVISPTPSVDSSPAGRIILPTEFTLAELQTMPLPPERFTVTNLLPVGLTLLAGKPKLGKSWLALQLALSLTEARPFLNEQVTAGDVLYLALEDSPARLLKRTKLLEPEAAPHTLAFRTEVPNAYEDRVTVLREWLHAHPNASCVIIDVWGRFAPALNGKDDYGQVTRIMQPLQTLAHDHGVSILLIHHAKKGDAEGGDPFDMVLGSTALTSNADASMILTRARGQGEALLYLTGRDVEERELSLTRQGVRWEPSSLHGQKALSLAQQEVLDMIGKGLRTAATIADALQKSRTAVQNILTNLLEGGFLVQAGRGQPYYLPGQLPETPTLSPVMSAGARDMTDKHDIRPILNTLDLI